MVIWNESARAGAAGATSGLLFVAAGVVQANAVLKIACRQLARHAFASDTRALLFRFEPENLNHVLSLAVRVRLEFEHIGTDQLDADDKRMMRVLEGAVGAIKEREPGRSA